MGIQHRNNRRRKRKLLNLLGSLATESPQYFGNAYQRLNNTESNNAESPAVRIEREAAEELERREELAEQSRRDRIRRNRFSGGHDITERPEPEKAQGESEGAATGGPLSENLS